MANGARVGVGSAYLQLRVPDSGINQSLQHWGGVEAGKRRQEDAAKEADKKRRAKELEKYNVDPEDFDIENGGYTDLNSANRELATNMLSQYSDLMYTAKQAYNANDTQKADKIFNQANQIRGQFKNMQATMETHKTNFDSYQKDFNDGKVSGWSKGFGNYYKGGLVEGKFKFGTSPNGDIVRMVQFQDDNGSLKTQTVSDKDVQNGNFRYYLKQDTNKVTTDIAKGLGDTLEQSTSGYFTTKNIQWGDKQEKTTRELVNANVGSPEFMADMVDQFDLYEEFGIDEANPPAIGSFTEEQKKVVADKLVETVKGKYNTTMEQKFNTSKYSADVRANTARQKGKDKTDDDDTVSNLKYDVDQAISGDYEGLLKTYTDKNNLEFTITDVVETPDNNRLVLIKSDGTEVELPKNPRAISDFIISNTPEYTKSKVSTEKVLSAEPSRYRESTTEASSTSKALEGFFDKEGVLKTTVLDSKNSRKLANKLKDLGYDVDLEVNFSSPDILKINGSKIKLSSDSTKEEISRQIDNAIKSGDADPLGLGIY